MKRLPTIHEIVRAIKLPTRKWMGNCCFVVQRILEKGLVDGTLAYGFWLDPLHEDSFTRLSRLLDREDNWRQPPTHGWILRPDGHTVVDPTRWVFENARPYLFCGESHGEYGELHYSREYRRQGTPPAQVPFGSHRELEYVNKHNQIPRGTVARLFPHTKAKA